MIRLKSNMKNHFSLVVENHGWPEAFAIRMRIIVLIMAVALSGCSGGKSHNDNASNSSQGENSNDNRRRVGFDPGFNVNGLLTLELSIPPERYREGRQQEGFFEQLIERIARLPGVAAAGAVSTFPLSNDTSSRSFLIEGRAAPDGGQDLAIYSVATPGYFQAAGIPLLAGRSFTAYDRSDSQPIVIISEAMARRYFPGEDPIGKRISFSDEDRWREIVGVVRNVKRSESEENMLQIYAPHAQMPVNKMTIVVRGNRGSDMSALIPALNRQVQELDPDVSVSKFEQFK